MMLLSAALKNNLDQMKSFLGVDIGMVDLQAKVISSTDENPNFEMSEVYEFITSKERELSLGEYFFKKIYVKGKLDFIAYMKSQDETKKASLDLVGLNLGNLKQAYKERYDKEYFMKNLVLDNMLLSDVYDRAKKLGLNIEDCWVVYNIEVEENRDTVLEIVRSIFPNKNKDFIFITDNKIITLIKQLKENRNLEDIEELANVIIDTINAEVMSKINISIGGVVENIIDVSRSFKEAKVASEIGQIFYQEKPITSYSKLGVGRLIYQLPVQLCTLFLKEVLQDLKFEDFDEETLTTINKFFEYSLNVSETSRQLFIHRNTLVYRLDKIQKLTGLDLRQFDDAIVFKIALMVHQYLRYAQTLRR